MSNQSVQPPPASVRASGGDLVVGGLGFLTGLTTAVILWWVELQYRVAFYSWRRCRSRCRPSRAAPIAFAGWRCRTPMPRSRASCPIRLHPVPRQRHAPPIATKSLLGRGRSIEPGESRPSRQTRRRNGRAACWPRRSVREQVGHSHPQLLGARLARWAGSARNHWKDRVFRPFWTEDRA